MDLYILLATGNDNKVREVNEIASEYRKASDRIHVISMKAVGIDSDPEETGSTFIENARIKARAVAGLIPSDDPDARRQWQYSHGIEPEGKLIVVADDSGLVIDAMGGMPGIYSARYLGRDTSYSFKMNHILEEMKDVPDEKRTARFVAAIAAVLPDGTCCDASGTMEGRIGHEICGANGFGYDPFFYLPAYGKTSAELQPDEKNKISHRGKGIRAMFDQLQRL